MPKPLQSDLERLRYWQGQKLCARDFSDQLSYQGQYRFWHKRARARCESCRDNMAP